MLHAFLMFNDRFEIQFAGHFLHREHQERIQALLPFYLGADDAPTSFWMKRIS